MDSQTSQSTAQESPTPGSPTSGSSPSGSPTPGSPQPWRRELLKLLADLRLAIVLLLVIAIASISGTVIEQGQSLAYYQSNYPTDPALFGFLSWRVLVALGLDHVYRTWWFLSLLIVFGASLTACTFNRQWPALKAAQTWQFYHQPRQFEKLATSARLTDRPQTLATAETWLAQHRYRIFREGDRLYARKGIAGRVGPIVVHASMLIILAGSIWGALGGFLAQEMPASGDTFQVKNILDAGPWALGRVPQDWAVRVNRFWIDYTPEGAIDQFYSDLSVIDAQGEERDRETIYVNKPLRYRGITLYQTDWGIAGVRVHFNNSPSIRLPMALLDTGGTGRVWGTWVPTKPDLSEGVSLVTRDLQGTLLIYDMAGKPIATTRVGRSVTVNGLSLVIDELIGSTGLQIKADPGIPMVYTGFALLMLGTLMSYVSHSQVWLLRSQDQLYIGGRTNRAQVSFEQELLTLVDALNAPITPTESHPEAMA